MKLPPRAASTSQHHGGDKHDGRKGRCDVCTQPAAQPFQQKENDEAPCRDCDKHSDKQNQKSCTNSVSKVSKAPPCSCRSQGNSKALVIPHCHTLPTPRSVPAFGFTPLSGLSTPQPFSMPSLPGSPFEQPGPPATSSSATHIFVSQRLPLQIPAACFPEHVQYLQAALLPQAAQTVVMVYSDFVQIHSARPPAQNSFEVQFTNACACVLFCGLQGAKCA